MSIKAVGWALDQSAGVDAVSKLVLIALCEASHRDDDCAWLSRAGLADIALVASTRTADRCLRDLEAAGYVARVDESALTDERRAMYMSLRADRRPTIYRIERGADIAPRRGASAVAPRKPSRGAERGAKRGAKRGAVAAAPEPIEPLEPYEPRPETSRAPDFDLGTAALKRIKKQKVPAT